MSGFDRLVYQHAVFIYCIRTTWTETVDDSEHSQLTSNHFFSLTNSSFS